MPHQECGGISRPLWQVEWVSEELSEPGFTIRGLMSPLSAVASRQHEVSWSRP